jgi:hypothetical protein
MTHENSLNADSTTNLTSPAKGKIQKLSKNGDVGEDATNDDFGGIDGERDAKESNPLNPNGAAQNAKDRERALIVSITQGKKREKWTSKVEFLLAVIGCELIKKKKIMPLNNM